MVRRLLAAGFSVTVWNRTYAKAQLLEAAGARAQHGLAAAVGGAGIVISMLEAGPVVAEVLQQSLPAW